MWTNESGRIIRVPTEFRVNESGVSRVNIHISDAHLALI